MYHFRAEAHFMISSNIVNKMDSTEPTNKLVKFPSPSTKSTPPVPTKSTPSNNPSALFKPKTKPKPKNKKKNFTKNVINNFYNFKQNPMIQTATKSTGMTKTGMNTTSSGFQYFSRTSNHSDVAYYFDKSKDLLELVFDEIDLFLEDPSLMDDDSSENAAKNLKKSFKNHFGSAEIFYKNLLDCGSFEFFIWSNYLNARDKCFDLDESIGLSDLTDHPKTKKFSTKFFG